MKPLAECPPATLARVRGLLFDIDDTLTTGGRLTARAYAALERLQRARLLTVAVTGRPAGWCDQIARLWPVDGVVGENGAFAFWHDRGAHRLRSLYLDPPALRAEKRARLAAVRERILAEVPGCALASDQPYRELDLAIDYCEDVARLPPAAVERIVALMRAAGMTARVSSIHVNGWFGDYDKLGMARRFLAEVHGIDLDARRDQFVFLGDSPNDAPMFRWFPHSVGVANVADFAGRIEAAPAWTTRARSGAGFVELAAALLAARAGPPADPRAGEPSDARASTAVASSHRG